ncbi:MAG TPA: hypothetical protein VNA14_14140 [Mycobacteriales bacterium]|nr:hypothetical protein [Mycobacteriales bacterium]
MLVRLRAAVALTSCLLVAAPIGATAGPSGPVGEPAKGVGLNLVPVANIPNKGGTDLEFTTIKGKDYAVAPTEAGGGRLGGLHIIDISKPERPVEVGTLPCNVTQNDVQVRGTLVMMGVDGSQKDDVCYEQIGAKPAQGLLIISIANPRKPRTVGFLPIKLGVHNSTWHPDGRYVYISDSELFPSSGEPAGQQLGRINVVDVANPRAPKMVYTLPLPPGLSSHDITFNAKGDKAYSAAITQTLVLDTENPAKPVVEHIIIDPAINISHGADPTPDGKYLLVTDEQSGAAANGICNAGGVHIYDLTLPVPVKVGFYPFSPTNSLTATLNSQNLTCTAHVLDYSPDGKTFSNAGYAAGVRIVSTESLIGMPKELAYFTATDADTWSAKTYKNPKYLFANDLVRGFDVFRYDPKAGAVDTRTPAQKARIDFRSAATSFAEGQYCFTLPTA